MGYTTKFSGEIAIDPPLSETERAYLKKFTETRRMLCTHGPYYVDRPGFMGQDRDASVINYNAPSEGQPGLWCQWVPNEDGTALELDEGDFAAEWMKYLIDHFIGAEPLARCKFPFFTGHKCNGEIEAQGEDSDDRWKLIVVDNVVSVAQAEIVYGKAREL